MPLFPVQHTGERITAISNPLFRTTSGGKGVTVSQGKALVDPLGLTIAPNGDLIATKLVDTGGGPPPGASELFGIVALSGKVYFVDDGTNTLNVLQ